MLFSQLTAQERNEWVAFFKIEAERMNPDKKESDAVQAAKNDIAFNAWKKRAQGAR